MDKRTEASVQHSELILAIFWTKAGLKVLVNRPWSSSEVKDAKALEQASFFKALVFECFSHLLSVVEHFFLSIERNSSSADKLAFVSMASCFAGAFFSSASASSAVLEPICSCPAALPSSFADFRSHSLAREA